MIVTGSSGRVGRVVMDMFPHGTGVDLLERDLRHAFTATHDDTLIHLAGDLTEAGAGDNLAMLRNALTAWRPRRLVLASTLRVADTYWREDQPLYTRSKLGMETLAETWAGERPWRSAVALRLGWFDPGNDGEGHPLHQAVRLTERGLRFWINRALMSPLGYHAWAAVGDPDDALSRVDEPRAPPVSRGGGGEGAS